MAYARNFPAILLRLRSDIKDGLAISAAAGRSYRETCVVAFEKCALSMFSSSVLSELVTLFNSTAVFHPDDFDEIFWQFVDTLDRFVRGPSGQMRDLAACSFRDLLKKYPATMLFSKLENIFTKDWYFFQHADMEESSVVETMWLKVNIIFYVYDAVFCS